MQSIPSSGGGFLNLVAMWATPIAQWWAGPWAFQTLPQRDSKIITYPRIFRRSQRTAAVALRIW
jgi:hypothetical protein